MFRLVAGARARQVQHHRRAVFSPRVAVVIKPHRISRSACRTTARSAAPSMINNHLDTTIAERRCRSGDHPRSAAPIYRACPIDGRRAIPDLTEESLDAFEIGYTGFVARARHAERRRSTDQRSRRDLLHAGRHVHDAERRRRLPGFPPPLRPLLNVLNSLGSGFPVLLHLREPRRGTSNRASSSASTS